MGTERSWRRAAAAAASVAVLFSLWIRLRIGGEATTKAFSDLTSTIVPIAAAGACAIAARREQGKAA